MSAETWAMEALVVGIRQRTVHPYALELLALLETRIKQADAVLAGVVHVPCGGRFAVEKHSDASQRIFAARGYLDTVAWQMERATGDCVAVASEKDTSRGALVSESEET